MKSKVGRVKVLRRCTTALLATIGCVGMQMQDAMAAPYAISNLPLNMLDNVTANLVLTLDDSSSMRRAFVPELICDKAHTRRAKSSYFNGMYYDPNTTYLAPPNPAGGTLSTTFGAAYVNGFNTSSSQINLATSYRVTWGVEPNATSLPTDYGDYSSSDADDRLQCGSNTDPALAENPGTDFPGLTQAGVRAYYYIFVPNNNGDSSCVNVGSAAAIEAARDKDACYVKVDVSSAEEQNFANWFSFYRTRNLATVSAASRSMMSDSVFLKRVAWQALSDCDDFDDDCEGWDGSESKNKIRVFDATHRTNFLKWVQRLPANHSTPLRRAMDRVGEYYSTDGADSPYGFNPNQSPAVTGKPEYSCRPNFHLMMTDGYWNTTAASGAAGGNADNPASATTLPDGQSYDPASASVNIFRGAQSGTLADVAFHYWSTDLRPGSTGLRNNVQPYFVSGDSSYWNPANDPATWQHMVNYMIGFGLTRNLNRSNLEWGSSTHSGTGYTNLRTGPSTSYTWPDPFDSDGDLRDQARVYDLWHAAINSRGELFPADKPDQLVTAFEAVLNRLDRGGVSTASVATNATRGADLVFQADFDSSDWTGKVTAYEVLTTGAIGGVAWTTSLPAYSSRKIYTLGTTGAISFEETPLKADGLWSALGTTDAAARSVLRYLLGDNSEHVKQGGSLRDRSTGVGDIVNSAPTYSANSRNFGYISLPEGVATATRYDNFLTTKAGWTPAVFVGSNNGMLHAFDARKSGGGGELFAYVPRALLLDSISGADSRSKLVLLTQLSYSHRFYVDGTPVVNDALVDSAWRSVLVGSTGAGARAVFALDVSNPQATTAPGVLWELDATADPNLGHVLGRPAIARFNDGKFYAVFGNGYKSQNECPVLYIVELTSSTSKAVHKLVASNATPCTDNNGLGTPSLFDANGDRVVDAIYAGDLQGNVWKFDVSSTTSSSWSVAYTASSVPQPLFTARNAAGEVQPITAKIEIGAAPPGRSGVMLYFGTGRFFAVGDKTDNTRQSMYGIHDSGTAITSTDRSVLQQQTVARSYNAATPPEEIGRAISSSSVNWSTKRGWYFDLPANNERSVSSPALVAGRLWITSFSPLDDPCVGGVTGWLYALSPFSGGQLPAGHFFSGGYDGIRLGAGDNPTWVQSASDGKMNIFLRDPQTGKPTSLEASLPIPSRERTSWRDVGK